MNSAELKQRLQQMGIPSYLYNLDGVGRTDERFSLDFTDNEWRVSYIERGVRTTEEKFPSEEAACEYIYQRLTN